jgi:glycerate 2-kinase
MAHGTCATLGEKLRSGIVITRHGYTTHSLPATISQLESGHPLPDGASLKAAERLIRYLHDLPTDEPLIFLLSGGSSALIEQLTPGTTLEDLQRFNTWALATGQPIATINRLRKQLSTLKGGRLASHLKQRPTLQLILSDVAGDDLATIGSGPLIYHPASPLTTDESEKLPLPSWLTPLLAQAAPLAAKSEFANIESHVIGNNRLARQTIAGCAAAIPLPCYHHDNDINSDLHTLATTITTTLQQQRGIHIWGGESHITLPAQAGYGGRCQHLALLVAQQLAGQSDWWLLAAASDGSDGNSSDAGALVDGATLKRGESYGGGNAQHAIAAANSAPFLHAAGDLIATGPSSSNVMDLYIGWSNPL